MADTKISSLAAVTDVLTTDEYVVARAGTTKKITAGSLQNAVGGRVLIQEIVVPSGGGSIDFTSIPALYRHLELALWLQTEHASAQWATLRFNNDSGAHYWSQVLMGVGGSTSAAKTEGQTAGRIAPASGTGESQPVNAHAWIADYLNTAILKYAMAQYAGYYASNGQAGNAATLWNQTSAINQITIGSELGADLKQGSYAILYGISP